MNKTIKNRVIREAVDTYPNVNFKDGVVGNSYPSKDTINTSLLQDVQTAAKNANLNVDITTAVSGHNSGTRHESGNAVDIAIINGKSVSPSNRADADKLVGELIKLGYTKNVESGNAKSVLTFGFKGHDNHVHVSNAPGTKGVESSTTTASATPENDVMSDFANKVGKVFFPKPVELSLKEDIDRIKELLK